MFTSSRQKLLLTLGIFLILMLAAYLPFIHKTGYLGDDWNTLFITENRGAGSLVDHFSIDRPLRGYFGLLEYRLLGTDLMAYQASALLFRYLDAVFIFLSLMLLWPKKWFANIVICSLVILFPGFHEQTHAFDYQAHLFSRMCIVLSIYLSLAAVSLKKIWLKIAAVLAALMLALVGYGLMEYYVGLEALRLALLFVQYRQQETPKKIGRSLLYWAVFVASAAIFTVWRLFYFESRRGSVDAGGMLAEYQAFLPKVLANLADLSVNLYRLFISAYYKPLSVFSKEIPAGTLFTGIGLALLAAGAAVFLLSRIHDEAEEERKTPLAYCLTLIIVGFFGAAGALLPVVFGGREITYYLSGDRFSYPGSISACLFMVGLVSLIPKRMLQRGLVFALLAAALATQFSNNYINHLNYIQTNQTWWQMAWRAPQLERGTLLSGSIAYGMNDEDYTFWAPANLLYYPEEHDPQITAEVLDAATLPKFLAQYPESYTRKTITYTREFGNLLMFTKSAQACLHVIDGQHPEFSEADPQMLREAAAHSDLNRIDVNSSYDPEPRVDLFGAAPEAGWCYYYQKAQLERQKRDWQKAAEYGNTALEEGSRPSDVMEWLVFVQAFAYTHNTQYDKLKQAVLADAYVRSQACSVFSTYTEEMAGTEFEAAHAALLADFCER